MLRLLGIVLSVGLADSLDPTTVGPGLYLALGERPARRVLDFALGVFVVMLISGLTVVLLPGQVLLHLVPHPHKIVEYWLETGVGVALIAAAVALWCYRRRLAARELFRAKETRRGSSFLLGVGIMAVNLPVAVPYFAAIAVIVGSGRPAVVQASYIALYSLCFIAPLLAMALVLWLAPERSEALLAGARQKIQRHWSPVLAVVLMLAGVFALVLGATGVASHGGGHLGHLARHLHRLVS